MIEEFESRELELAILDALPLHTEWSKKEKEYLINALLHEQVAGWQVETGWKPTAWQHCSEAILRAGGCEKSGKQCKTMWQKLKSQFVIVHWLRSASGFGWNEIDCCVTATDQVWDDYCKIHPKAAYFRNHSFPLYNKMKLLCADVLATGHSAVSSHMPSIPIDPVLLEEEDHSQPEPEEMDFVQSQQTQDVDAAEESQDTPAVPAAPHIPMQRSDSLEWHSSASTARHPRSTGAHALASLSQSVETLVSVMAHAATSSTPVGESPTHAHAFKMICEREKLPPARLVAAPHIFHKDRELAHEYLSFPDTEREAQKLWLEEEIEEVMHIRSQT